MSTRIIRLAEIVSTKDRKGMLPVSPATIWRWVREGKFPKPFKLGAAVTVWNLDDVTAFVNKQAANISTSSQKK